MSFSCGIVGLPNAGKSTIFNALTSLCIPSQPYPFCTIEPNIGIVPVPDIRLNTLGDMIHPDKLTPTTIEFVDIAGLMKDAHKGEGLGNRFLSHIRNVDAVAHVLRVFESGSIPHVYTDIDAKRDMEIVETEIIISDLEIVEDRIGKLEHVAKISKEKCAADLEVLYAGKSYLEKGHFIPEESFTEDQKKFLHSLNLITLKPLFYIANIGEGDLNKIPVDALESVVMEKGKRVVYICGKLEEELALLEDSEQAAYMRLYGMKEMSVNKVIRVGYEVLGLITFYTLVGKEIRAWTIPAETPCAQAAGKIHSDMERGFIKAEVINFSDFEACRSEQVARERGLLRIEGREYLVQDGDILHIRFNV